MKASTVRSTDARCSTHLNSSATLGLSLLVGMTAGTPGEAWASIYTIFFSNGEASYRHFFEAFSGC